MELIDKNELLEELKKIKQNLSASPIVVIEDVKILVESLEVKEVEEEPTSNDLEEAIKKYLKSLRKSHFEGYDIERAFKKGAQWQEGQMEKNRIEHCDNITEEQYNLETEFLDDFLDKNKRMPTFLDAIEYGMKKTQKGE